MGIFKKTKQKELPIKPGISDSEREAERLRQLEASLDFLRDNPSSPPRKAMPSESDTMLPQKENNDCTLSGNVPDSLHAKESDSPISIHPDQNNSHDEKTNSQENAGADIIEKENTDLNKNSREDHPTKEQNAGLSQKEAEEAEIARQKAIRNKYGRRMDYKTAKVSKDTSNSSSSVSSKSTDDLETAKEHAFNMNAVAESAPDSSELNQAPVSNHISANTDTEEKSNTVSESIESAKESNSKKDLHAENNDNEEKDSPEKNADISKTETEKNMEVISSEPIENPLPTPAKHARREMEFDVMPTSEDMHFDLVDLTGMDFFDIN